ncbi:tRNA (adenosine(37)-N6)-threonylcarbamoyltransferase complex transferase subunit TsaD [Tepidibacter aestuarii]|uniref:O-sialoglycoprotein endopeptidase n=1 Tax=Tepidibacter aestuarii TaxID=2925782 RepID=UPI0020C04C1F|nr:O-sialoglycoprotein endopeptidase [Tepidibacter aestuarii]CAH2212887.1 N6-L-threonylcarbamoyladenine synthase [Tepidibacter aestuarii]
MICKNKIILGIDTSCYTTSIAAINLNKEIIINEKKMLKVKNGNRGLRQSDAFFQHVNNLGDMFGDLKNRIKDYDIVGLCVSSKPRPIEGSYMPVFGCGYKFAKTISSVLNAKLYETSHQECHIESAFYDTNIDKDRFLCIHMSGGTTEILLVNRKLDGYDIEIVGATKDISAGQLIDRVGVKLGYEFPCGKYLDQNALKCSVDVHNLKISSKEGYINFSGVENQIFSIIDDYSNEYISKVILNSILDSIYKSIIYLSDKYNIKDVLFVGGVSSSEYISCNMIDKLSNNKINAFFTKPSFAKDNAIGSGIIGVNRFLSEV